MNFILYLIFFIALLFIVAWLVSDVFENESKYF